MSYKSTALKPWRRSSEGPYLNSFYLWTGLSIGIIFGSVLAVSAAISAYNAGYVPKFLVPYISWFFNWVVGVAMLIAFLGFAISTFRHLHYVTWGPKEDSE